MRIIVTGGAGYIGSHIVKALGECGDDILVLDNLSTGHERAVLYGRLVKGDLSDLPLLDRVISEFRPEAVMHFAASIEVAESVRDPLKYYRNNAVNTMGLLDTMTRHDVHAFIFSSTAAVYGTPRTVPIDEQEPLRPVNPYGMSKVVTEEVLADLSRAGQVRYVSLRYFNAAGSDPSGLIGESHEPESHLIPLVLKAAKGVRERVTIYGTDYPTPDGTCIRDFIHVNDLADIHLRALDHLAQGGQSRVYNCGYGHGYSVREVVAAAQKVTGTDLAVIEGERRPGDPPELVADSSLLRSELSWSPGHDDLEHIVRTAWAWENRQ